MLVVLFIGKACEIIFIDTKYAIILMFLSIYLLEQYSVADAEINFLKSSKSQKILNFVKFSKISGMRYHKDMILIICNTQYHFFYEQKRKAVIVIPNADIRYIVDEEEKVPLKNNKSGFFSKITKAVNAWLDKPDSPRTPRPYLRIDSSPPSSPTEAQKREEADYQQHIARKAARGDNYDQPKPNW